VQEHEHNAKYTHAGQCIFTFDTSVRAHAYTHAGPCHVCLGTPHGSDSLYALHVHKPCAVRSLSGEVYCLAHFCLVLLHMNTTCVCIIPVPHIIPMTLVTHQHAVCVCQPGFTHEHHMCVSSRSHTFSQRHSSHISTQCVCQPGPTHEHHMCVYHPGPTHYSNDTCHTSARSVCVCVSAWSHTRTPHVCVCACVCVFVCECECVCVC
jgi:hypothetical protein